jgi:multiple sugar transport system substrate-binding protein
MEENSTGEGVNVTPALSRRKFLGVGGAVAATGAVAARGGGLSKLLSAPLIRPSTSKASPITFWDMEWGAAAYNIEGAALAKQYNTAHPNSPAVKYQAVTWDNVYAKFASAIASKTNPDCSSGSGYQAFQFSQQGAIQPLDGLVAMLQKDGTAADFYPGLLEVMRYQGHYVAIPWEIDIRVLYYRKSLVKQVGGAVPKTWNDLLTLGKALKKKGIFLFNTGGNPSFNGWQDIIPFMIGNGGGFFNAKGEPDATQEANVEAVEFLLQLSKDGYIDPQSISFNQTEWQAAFGSGKVAFAYGGPKEGADYSPSVSADLGLTSPLKSPSGKTGTIYWVNNLMAYKGSYDVEGMYEWYSAYESLMKAYWSKGLVTGLPVRKSFASIPSVANNPQISIPLKEWLPVAKTTASQGHSLSPGLNALEGSSGLAVMTQQIIQGSQSAKSILSAVQPAIEKAMST